MSIIRLAGIKDLANPEDAAAALAELRAYGGLLEAGFTVTPIPRTSKATPDFEIDAGDGPVTVEVFAKHQDRDQAQLLEAIADGETPPGVERKMAIGGGYTIETVISEVQPGGAPDPSKPNDSVQANLISRVCAAKGDERQIPNDRPSILWIDFRSFGRWPEIVNLEQTAPLVSGHHGITSGALWYAFYGWRGAPIFEEDFVPRERIFYMGHDGRFRLTGQKKSKLSAVIFALSESLVMLENPWAEHPIPDKARRYCERLPWFNIGRSICNCTPGDAGNLVNAGQRQIEWVKRWHDYMNNF